MSEQHTTTHCNTLQHKLQHIATHCNTLQRPATPCNTPQHPATHCNTLQHTATHRITLQHTATHCNTPEAQVPGRARALCPHATRAPRMQPVEFVCRVIAPSILETKTHTIARPVYPLYMML